MLSTKPAAPTRVVLYRMMPLTRGQVRFRKFLQARVSARKAGLSNRGSLPQREAANRKGVTTRRARASITPMGGDPWRVPPPPRSTRPGSARRGSSGGEMHGTEQMIEHRYGRYGHFVEARQNVTQTVDQKTGVWHSSSPPGQKAVPLEVTGFASPLQSTGVVMWEAVFPCRRD